MPVHRPKGAKGRADRLFSELVRSRGACERCGEREFHKLQTAHIFSRRFSNTRCDPDNALCLCAACHRWFTDRPVEFAEFCKAHMGEHRYEALRARAQQLGKVDWRAVCGVLEGLLGEAA